MVDTPDKLLAKLPKQTPVWAIGIVSVIVGASVSLGFLYFTAKSEVEKVVDAHLANSSKKIQAENEALSSVLDLVRVNSEQITSLSSALFRAQEENADLTRRVTAIEKELAASKNELSECKLALKSCKK